MPPTTGTQETQKQALEDFEEDQNEQQGAGGERLKTIQEVLGFAGVRETSILKSVKSLNAMGTNKEGTFAHRANEKCSHCKAVGLEDKDCRKKKN